jgi:isopenicillin-N epimerase
MGFDGEEKVCAIPFGKATKHTLFELDSSIHFTNHGSYGTAPKLILERKRQFQSEMERCPDKWFRFTAFPLWENSMQALADYLKVSKSNVLLFENTTEAVGTVFKWVEFAPGDAILTTGINYQAVLNAIDYTAKYRFKPEDQVQVIKVVYRFFFFRIKKISIENILVLD